MDTNSSMIKKIILLCSSIALLGYSIFLYLLPDSVYEGAKSKYSIEEMNTLSEQYIDSLRNEAQILNREELIKIAKFSHESQIANEAFIESQYEASKSLTNLLIYLVVLHILILYFTIGNKGKPNKPIK